MLKLVCFDLRNPDEWEQFYNLFSTYLFEVCDEEEYRENIDDLHDEKLNRQMIEQTLQKKNPYFIMQIRLDERCIGLGKRGVSMFITVSFRHALLRMENGYIVKKLCRSVERYKKTAVLKK